MTEAEAISKLSKYKSLPADRFLTEREIIEYRDILDLFDETQNPNLIMHFIETFSYSNGVPLFEEALISLSNVDKEIILPILKDYVTHENTEIRYWTLLLANKYDYPELVGFILPNLQHEDPSIRMITVNLIFQANTKATSSILESHLEKETSHHVRLEILDLLLESNSSI